MAATDQRDETQRRPSLIASHVDVTYRVFGAKKVGTVSGVPNAGNRLARLLKGRRPSVSTVREVHAVKDVSFVAYHGESIGIIGRNGSGKSTLLRALAGLIPATNGEIYTAGRPALLGVNAVLMRELSGERNVMIGGQAMGLTAKEVRAKMDAIVEFSGVGEFIDLPMKAYSSGMAARLRFAISTAAVPEILMIDEALATGDADFQARSQQRVEEIREHAGTVFLVSHSERTVRAMCDRALWLERGELLMDGRSDEVLAAYQRAYKRPVAKKRPVKKPPAKKPAAKKPPAEKLSTETTPATPAEPPAQSAVEKPAAGAEPATASEPVSRPPGTAASTEALEPSPVAEPLATPPDDPSEAEATPREAHRETGAAEPGRQ